MTGFNSVMMQFFHWYVPPDGNLWTELQMKAGELFEAGITALWLPPAYKGIGGSCDVGYGLYDLYDLGEFDQKGSVRTKYGTREQYLAAVQAAKGVGLEVYADVVFNHMLGGDHLEQPTATPFHEDNRHQPLDEPRTIQAWTHFDFPGRQGEHSTMEWHWQHFTAVDYDENNPEFEAIYLFEGKSFDQQVDLEKGSFDYLMGCDLDVQHPEVQTALKDWGEWYINTVPIDGVRFDAVKHIQAGFFPRWLSHIREKAARHIFAVGEYWSYEVEALQHFIGLTGREIALFDAPLHLNFAQASQAGKTYDLQQIFDNTLVQSEPELAVTLVANHDTQPLQALESVVEPWFKPLAYALILLRKEGYPCIFYADYFGAQYQDTGTDGQEHEIFMDCHRWLIDKFLWARHTYSYGEQYDYFDHPNTVGWTRLGNEEHPGGIAVLLSNGEEGRKWMDIGQPNQTYYDVTEHCSLPVTTNEQGWTEFFCPAGSVSVWVPVK